MGDDEGGGEVFDGRSRTNADVFALRDEWLRSDGLQMKSRGSISGGIGWICFNASLKKIERMRVIYIRVLDTRRLRKRLSLVLLGLNLGADVCTVQR